MVGQQRLSNALGDRIPALEGISTPPPLLFFPSFSLVTDAKKISGDGARAKEGVGEACSGPGESRWAGYLGCAVRGANKAPEDGPGLFDVERALERIGQI